MVLTPISDINSLNTMENIDLQEDVVTSDDTQDLDLSTEQQDEEQDTSETDSRISELEAELAKYKRIAEQRAKKLERSSPQAKSTPKNAELGWGEKAYLVANGVKGEDEFAIIQEAMLNTGKSLDEVMNNKFVQSQLNDHREQKALRDRLPESKRSGRVASTTVDYWVAKGELPPRDQTQLRREVVNARLKADTQKSKFAN